MIVPTVATVGLVVPTLGTRPEWLDQALTSIKRNKVEGISVRVVVVGPANEVVIDASRKFGYQVLAQTGRGLSNAINTGWNELASTCQFFSWLGDDDLLSPLSLASAVEALKEHSEAKFVYGRTRYIDAQGNSIYTSRPTRWAPRYMKIGKDFVPQPGSLIRTQCVTWTPLLDENLKNAMDLDLFLKLSYRQTTWIYLKRELSAYRLHGGAITSNKGSLDESDSVRDRYRSHRIAKIARFTGTPRSFLEKLVIWFPWHWPKSADYRREGQYCRPETAKMN